MKLIESAVNLARDLGFGVQCAVADTPAGAQAFANSLAVDGQRAIVPRGEERERLKSLSLPHLLSLEGLEPWPHPQEIESIITFFMMLGFRSFDDLTRFTIDSFKERWGETGELLWKRLRGNDRQVISPLLPTEPLRDYAHLDFPVSLVSLLLHQLEKSVDFLFARLQGQGCVAQRLNIILHCEYSKAQHKIVIEPLTPSRDRGLFLTLLEKRLGELNLENPVRDFEVHIAPLPEKPRQLDFFEPQNADEEKVQSLFNLLLQSNLKPGFYQIEPSIVPERTWRIVATVKNEKSPDISLSKSTTETSDISAVTPQPHYGSAIMTAPRPTRILKEPFPLSLEELRQFKILSSNPIERLETDWWETREIRRDYFFAISKEGECVWIFKDLTSGEYFLHGYFD